MLGGSGSLWVRLPAWPLVAGVRGPVCWLVGAGCDVAGFVAGLAGVLLAVTPPEDGVSVATGAGLLIHEDSRSFVSRVSLGPDLEEQTEANHGAPRFKGSLDLTPHP